MAVQQDVDIAESAATAAASERPAATTQPATGPSTDQKTTTTEPFLVVLLRAFSLGHG